MDVVGTILAAWFKGGCSGLNLDFLMLAWHACMQETLRTEFSDRTLLAVAHRLHTIIEADR